MPSPPSVPVIKGLGGKELKVEDDLYAKYQQIAGQKAADMLSKRTFHFDAPTERDIERVKEIYSFARRYAKLKITPEVKARAVPK